MAYNKIVYGNNVLIDLTGDTVTPDKLDEGITAHKADGTQITGTSTKDSDTSDANVQVAEMLAGKTAYARGAKMTGTMPNRGAIDETIDDLDDVINVPAGYHDGSGTVQIDAVEKAKLIPQNIREGVTILNVEGAMSGSEDSKPQAKSVTPTSTQQVVQPDAGYNCLSQVTVAAIPYVETDNAAGGKTVTIG